MTAIVSILAVFAVLMAVYVGAVVFSPWIREQRQPFPGLPAAGRPAASAPEDERCREVRFRADGEEIAGSLYLPQNVKSRVPCVVLNHGLGGTRDAIVGQYASRFAQAGIAALTYDYRHFGGSGGQPRQLFLLDLQVADCRAAIAYVRSIPEIDAGRIAIWGTSAGGWYGLRIAAEDGGIACVSAQCASLDSSADLKLIFKREGIGYFFRLAIHASRDKGRARFGLSPHHIGIVGKPGAAALITAPGALEEYTRLLGPKFRNEVCARVMLTPHGKTAADVIDQLRCPALIQICEHDQLVSVPGTLGMAKRMGSLAEVKRYPIGHFDIYQGEAFERAAADQIEFFSRHLQV